MKGGRLLLLLGLSVALLGVLGLAYGERLPVRKAQAAPLAAPPMGSTHFGLNWSAFSSGGGEIASTHFRVASTIAQPATGNISSAHFATHTGYRQNLLTVHRIYLPLVLRAS